MDDDGYVRALLAILTNPNPAGVDPADPYGVADDGIDRYDGFGREVVVSSLDLAPGEHGAELVVTYAMVLPSDLMRRPIPSEGVVHLPFDRRWRELSGYAAPAAYAPQVASRVVRAAHQHVERHRDGEDRRNEQTHAHPMLPSRREQRQLLLDALRRAGQVAEVAPGRFELHLLDADRAADDGDVVTVLVTPDEWDDVLATRIGDDADGYIEEVLGPRDDDERFLVFYDGDLVRSTREQRPPVRGRAFEQRVGELRARHPEGEAAWLSDVPSGPDRDSTGGTDE